MLAKLDSAVVVQRANALAVLEQLCGHEEVGSSASSREAAQMLATALLSRLSDAELGLRLRSVRLFARLDAAFVVPRAASLLVRTSPEVRSAAEAAMLAALSGGESSAASATSTLIDVVRDGDGGNPAAGAAGSAGAGVSGTDADPGAESLVGQQVRIYGLVNRPQLNGRLGRVVSYDANRGRCHVDVEGENGLWLKPTNLQAALPAGGAVQPAQQQGRLPAHPGQIGPSAAAAADHGAIGGAPTTTKVDDTGGKSKFEERALVVVRKWTNTLGPSEWSVVLQVACAKFFAASDDTRVMAVLKVLVAAPGSMPHHGVVRHAAQRRLELSVPQESPGDAPSSAAAAAEAGEGPQLERLRPLLLLSVLPFTGRSSATSCRPSQSGPGPDAAAAEAAGLAGKVGNDAVDADDEGNADEDGDALRTLLLARMRDAGELQPVRKLAVTLLARLRLAPLLPAMLEAVRESAASPLEAAQRPESALSLYYVCTVCSLRPAAAAQVACAPGALDAAVSLACWRGRAPQTRQLQAGGADLLARLLCAEVERDAPLCAAVAAADPTAAPAQLVTEAVGSGGKASRVNADDTAVRSRLLALVSGAGGDDVDAALHVLAMAQRLQQAQGGSPAAARLACWAAPQLLEAQRMATDHRVTHVLFELAFYAQPQLPCRLMHALLRRALHDVRESAPELRLAGLKLLGVVLAAGGDGEVWGELSCRAELVAETLRLLRSLSDIDQSAGVRRLAASLLAKTSFTPPLGLPG